MRRIIGIGAAWLTATLVAVAVATAAVGSVRSEVTDSPTALAAPIVTADPTIATPSPDTLTTTAAPGAPPTTVVPADSTTTTNGQVKAPSETTSTTTLPAASTTTTTMESYTKTYDTEGGSIRITVSGESVTFAGATPLPGWKVELKNSGPEEVKVHFERNEDEHEEEEIEFKATVENGELKVSISEES